MLTFMSKNRQADSLAQQAASCYMKFSCLDRLQLLCTLTVDCESVYC